MSVYYLDKDKLFPEVKKRLKTTEIVLDVGCGIRPQKLVTPRVHICFEPYQGYLDHLQEKAKDEFDRSYLILKGTWEDAVKVLPPKSVDSVFLLDVIEHLEKKKGQRLLNATEKLAREQVVIFTPLGFVPQEHKDGQDAWGLTGGKWQKHKSGWKPDDFDDSWDIYVAKKYHFEDNLGKKYPKPYGAFFAIKNIARDKKRAGSKKKDELPETLESTLALTNKKLRKTQSQLRKAQKELRAIYGSRGWKIVFFLHNIRKSLPILKNL